MRHELRTRVWPSASWQVTWGRPGMGTLVDSLPEPGKAFCLRVYALTMQPRDSDNLLFFAVVGQSHLDSAIEDQEIVTNPPDICQVVEVTTESDEQPVSMSELYPLQISPVSSYAGKGSRQVTWRLSRKQTKSSITSSYHPTRISVLY